MKKIKIPKVFNNKNLLVIVLGLALLYSAIRSLKVETSFFDFKEDIEVLDTSTGEIKSYNMENYLIGVLAAEMPASFELEALKAQAIASRTYAYYKMMEAASTYDVTNDITSQAHITEEKMREKWGEDYDFYYNKIKEAIEATKDLIMTYDNEIICAYYYAMSNGYTENSQLVFKEDRDYLQSVTSLETEALKGFKVTTNISQENFCSALNLDCTTGVFISDRVASETGRILRITINGQEFIGTDIRKLLNLRSTDFQIKLVNGEVVITTRGYGHGVGMSQYGANLMAQNGNTYEEILTHYYTGVKITDISSIK